MDCYYCGWKNGYHNPHCPKENNPTWNSGNNDGSSGKEPKQIDDKVYMLGWSRGVIALEERQNGYDPRFDS